MFFTQNKALQQFKMDLFELTCYITLKPVAKSFQKNRKRYQFIKLSNKMFVADNKTKNIYKMDIAHY